MALAHLKGPPTPPPQGDDSDLGHIPTQDDLESLREVDRAASAGVVAFFKAQKAKANLIPDGGNVGIAGIGDDDIDDLQYLLLHRTDLPVATCAVTVERFPSSSDKASERKSGQERGNRGGYRGKYTKKKNKWMPPEEKEFNAYQKFN
ncbi:hypothetical protein HK101_008265 [Irineochytrium annulatum]|nr:hypothetical protein HK101_008265 [Irineochytrium annulatum]